MLREPEIECSNHSTRLILLQFLRHMQHTKVKCLGIVNTKRNNIKTIQKGEINNGFYE